MIEYYYKKGIYFNKFYFIIILRVLKEEEE